MNPPIRNVVRIVGVTQGVGFRPFVWRLADRLNLTGWVQNDSGGLTFEIQGDGVAVDALLDQLRTSPPPLAKLDSIEVEEIPLQSDETHFVIRESQKQAGESNPVTQDICVCEDCLEELTDAEDRRYRYPFINCTNCGPRFTIVEDLPYDRSATTMKSFPMCARCQSEYDDPGNRRFHAQPNACPDCGPVIWFVDDQQGSKKDLCGQSPAADNTEYSLDSECDAALRALRTGHIVAVKGIGGFHLVCDAKNEVAVATLRERKGRIEKPFAMMAASVASVREFAYVDPEEQSLLESKERPIVLLKKRLGGGRRFENNATHMAEPISEQTNATMLESVAPENERVGVMLPYSPLHYLLIEQVSPLVVTSGNISDEPIVRTNEEARARLAMLADGFLLHNREINVVCDDSVVRCFDGKLLPIRRSRGYAPMPVQLKEAGPSVLAVGGEIKATFCVTKDNYAYLSQHIGDVGNLETLAALKRNVDHFLKLFRIEVSAVAGDLHPDYMSSAWARQLAAELDVPFLPVQHHFAHAASLLAEQADAGPTETILACCLDGTGYGTDGAIWGGEFLLANQQEFQRVAHLQYYPLPGGDATIKRPRRVALALLARLQLDWDHRLPSVAACSEFELGLLRKQIESNLNCARTSSMGRLFDAISSLIGIRQQVSYEAQAAMEMEALASTVIEDVDPNTYEFTLSEGQPIQIGCEPLVRSVCEDVFAGCDRATIAARFHHAVAKLIVQVCNRIRQTSEPCRRPHRVGLTGGVFQNVLLLKLTQQALTKSGFDVLTHSVVPPNDGGLALGQAVVARSWLK